MPDLFIPELDNTTTISDTDQLVAELNPAATAETTNMYFSDVVANFLKRTTYQITRVVTSNNLIVAIKDSDGNNATAAKPLNFPINGSIRKLSGSLSVTVNAGANSFNLGATEFAALPQELFVYIGWRASGSSVFVLISRLPHIREYADFSSTATNEHYGAYSGSAPAATDKVVVIGRVNVTNSGTASYNWSVPASDQIINRPIFETNWLDFLPTQTGFSANPTTLVNRYKINYNTAALFVRQGANGTSNLTTFTLSLPLTAKTVTNMSWSSIGVVVDNGATQTIGGLLRVLSAATVMDVYKDMSAAVFTGSGGKRLSNMSSMVYEIT